MCLPRRRDFEEVVLFSHNPPTNSSINRRAIYVHVLLKYNTLAKIVIILHSRTAVTGSAVLAPWRRSTIVPLRSVPAVG